MVTYNCKGCSFSVSHLQMTARVTPDGGLRELRAWADHRLVPLQGRPNRHWMQGRNQALFSAATSPPLEITAAASAAASTPPLGLMVQPWLGLIGSLGAPRFTQHHINCSHRRRHASTCAHLTSGVHRLVAVTRGPSRMERLVLQRHLMARDPGNRGGSGARGRSVGRWSCFLARSVVVSSRRRVWGATCRRGPVTVAQKKKSIGVGWLPPL